MGSPISPAIANLVMEALETSVISCLTYELPFYKRYVDDILTCVHSDNLENIVQAFNSYHPKLKFTSELESEGRISFLGMSVINIDNRVHLDWYQKPTWSGRYLQFHSHHPEVHKKCVVAGLFERGLKLCEPMFREKNLKLITETLIQNGYPRNLINSIKASRVHKLYNSVSFQERLDLTTPSYTNFTVIPYVKGLSEQIKKLLNKHGVSVVFKVPNKTYSIFTRLKDPIPEPDQSNLVYMVDFANWSNRDLNVWSRYERRTGL